MSVFLEGSDIPHWHAILAPVSALSPVIIMQGSYASTKSAIAPFVSGFNLF
jgi:hypothetical protein